MPRRIAPALSLILAAAVCTHGQPLDFGSSDDPREAYTRTPWRALNHLYLLGGLSLIGADLRSAGNATFEWNGVPVAARISSTARVGYYGIYRRDFDEWYDALRTIEFVRYRPPVLRPVYLRAGPIERGRLGGGHLVNFYRSSAATNERTIGIEGALHLPILRIGAFSDDVRLQRVVGGQAALTPFFWVPDARIRSLRVTAAHARDLGVRVEGYELAGYSVEAGMMAFRLADIHLEPFFSYAWYDRLGSGISMGADLTAENLIDLARFRFRFAVDYYSDQFIPGYFNPFYQVSNPRDRLWVSEQYIADRTTERFAGVPINESRGGSSLTHEIRILVFETAEIWHFFRRHYGTQRLSEYTLQLFLFPRRSERFRFDVRFHRAGMQRFTDLFRSPGDENALVFNFDYRISGALWTSFRTLYGFRRVEDGPEGERRFLVERRFEPLAGIRLTF